MRVVGDGYHADEFDRTFCGDDGRHATAAWAERLDYMVCLCRS